MLDESTMMPQPPSKRGTNSLNKLRAYTTMQNNANSMRNSFRLINDKEQKRIVIVGNVVNEAHA